MRYPDFLRRRLALRRLANTIRREPFTILMFHSVGRSRAADFLPAALDCDPAFFRSVLKLLRRQATVLPYRELMAAIRENRVPKRAVAITFDDGFRETLTVAWPMLKEFGLPAILFVPVDVLAANELLPVHKLYYNQLLNGDMAPSPVSPERGPYMAKLLREHNVTAPPLGRELYLTWDELYRLRDEGMEIGAHTVSHAWLNGLPEDEQRREVVECRRILEQRLGQPVEFFAYPYGYYGASFTDKTVQLVREHFATAAAGTRHPGPGLDLHRLPRYGISLFYNL